MTYKARRRRLVVLLAATLLITSAVSLGVFSKMRREPKQQRRVASLKEERVTKLPPVFSKVKDVQVAGAALLKQGTPDAAITIDLVNNNDQAVISLEITSGDAQDWSSLGIDGLEDPDNPQVAIPPHTLKTFKWYLGEVLEGYPIVVTGARFADGTEDGDARTLEIMRKDRDRNRAQKARRADHR